MAKLIKILVGLIVVVVVLIGAAVLILPQVIDPNDYKDEIVQVVKEKTGRDLRIDKPLKLSVFPWLGVEAGGVVLGNAPGFGKEPFAQVDQLGVRVKLLPLLKRQIEVDTLVLEGVRLNLARNKQGKTNWEDLAAKGEAQPAEEEKEEAGGPAISSLKVQGIELRNARISWRDAQAGAHYVLDKVRLETGALAPGATVPVKAGFTLTSDAPRLAVVVDLVTQASASEDFKQFTLSDLELTVDGKGEGLPKGGMKVVVAANIEGDLAADTLKVEGLKVSGPQVEIKGRISIAGLQQQPRLKGHLELAQTNVKQLAALFGTTIRTTDPKALTRVSASIDLAQEGKATRLEPFTITLDDTHAKGYVRLLDTKGPVLRARLDVDAIDLDRYVPPAGAKDDQKGAGKQSKAAGKGAASDPFAPLRTLDLQADLKIGKLVVSKARLQNITVRVVSKGGLMKVAPIKASLYQGRFNGQVTLDARKKTPRIHAVKHLAGVQIGPLLKDVAGEDRLIGTGNLDLDLRVAGLSEAQIRRSLSGNGRFRFTDGAYKGVDIIKMIRNATGQGSNVSQSGNTEDKTEFTEMKGSFTARNGVISNSDLSAKSPLLRLTGKGTVNLPANTIDYTLTAKLVASLQGQGGKAADQLKGVPIPVKIKGPLDNPGYALDIEAILTEKAKQKVREKVEEKVKGALGDKLKGPLGEGLKGLFGR